MQKEPAGSRPHLMLLGRRNVGKSSLINALTNQPLSLVSAVPGTTTDPVRKSFELLPFGPVVFIDTAGIDDEGELGALRVLRTRKEWRLADLIVLVVEAGVWGPWEAQLFAELAAQNTPFKVVVNKSDLAPDWRPPCPAFLSVSSQSGAGMDALKLDLSATLRGLTAKTATVVGDLVKGGGLYVLVVPIDLEAPAGRLILPQVMTLRDILDHDGAALVVKERELYTTLRSLGRRPDLVICDSQVVLKVVGDLPPDQPLTTFSILFARLKGDLALLAQGARAIETLQDDDAVLISEACSHHSQGDDIGRVKIPRWIRQYTGRELHFDVRQGSDFPSDLEKYKLVVHCGACMLTPKMMQARMEEAISRGLPVTNYGLAISYVHGVFERVMQPFGLSKEA